MGAFLPGEAASTASWLKASLCRNGLGWGLGCRHELTGQEAAANIGEGEYGSNGYADRQAENEKQQWIGLSPSLEFSVRRMKSTRGSARQGV